MRDIYADKNDLSLAQKRVTAQHILAGSLRAEERSLSVKSRPPRIEKPKN